MKLKDIALELLHKYEEAQTTVIWEYSYKIGEDEAKLKAEVAEYKAMIENAGTE